MPDIAFNRYYRYDALTELLQGYASEHPDLVEVTSIGKSHEGRNIWLVTVTNKATGPAIEKPAFWGDGNIHASEVSASTTVLMILEKLVTTQRAILDTRTFYLVPRLNPDGAEWALEDVPRLIRSSTRPYPYDEDDTSGIQEQDMDGDGRILCMRVKDSNGPWKISPTHPRLMVRREPGESGGEYYRHFPEGLFTNFDADKLRSRKKKEGLDMNRNFPSAWRLEADQHGAGPYPTSEPEIRACVQAIVDRPNICSCMTFHTFSGVLLRPPARFADDDIPAEDLWNYKTLGAKGKEMTGYPDISNYHEFRYHPKEVITGTFDDWAYEHRGAFAWTVEIWSPQRQAGITDYKYIDWHRDHPFEDDVKLVEWSDTALEGNGYIDWYPFEHPQLGSVELGGWDAFYAFRNPPPQFLEKEITPLADWAIWHANTSPQLALRDFKIEKLTDCAKVRIVVQNTGWLPTYVTEVGKNKKLCRGVVAEITSQNGDPSDWLISGEIRRDGGQLTGYSQTMAGGWGWNSDDMTDVAVFEWVLKPGEYNIVVHHERAGTVRQSFTI